MVLIFSFSRGTIFSEVIPINDFEEHIRIMLFVAVGFIITFVIGFSLGIDKLWMAAMAAMIAVIGIILALARFGRNVA